MRLVSFIAALLLSSVCLAQEPPVASNVDALTAAQDKLNEASRLGQAAMERLLFLQYDAKRSYERASAAIGQSPKLVPVLPTLIPVPEVEPLPPPARKYEESEPPSLTLPLSISGDVGAFIPITARTNGTEVRWIALDPGLNVFPAAMLRTTTSTVVSASVPNRYRILAYTAIGDMPSDPAICVVTVGRPVVVDPVVDPTPRPIPTPTPVPPVDPPVDPPAPPVITSQQVIVVIVEDALQRTPQTAALLADLTYWKSFDESVVKHVHIIPVAAPIAKQYESQVNSAGGPPVVIIMACPSNKVLTAQRLPADKVTMSALISKYTTGK